MFRIVDRHGKQVHLTKERWSHIVSRHPELVNKLESIREIIANPDFEVKSKTNQRKCLEFSYRTGASSAVCGKFIASRPAFSRLQMGFRVAASCGV